MYKKHSTVSLFLNEHIQMQLKKSNCSTISSVFAVVFLSLSPSMPLNPLFLSHPESKILLGSVSKKSLSKLLADQLSTERRIQFMINQTGTHLDSNLTVTVRQLLGT